MMTKPKTPAKTVQPRTEKPQSFYNPFQGHDRPQSEIGRERAQRVQAGTWDPTPKGQKIAIDPELKRALFEAFAEHEEGAFLDLFEETHPKLVKDYKRWLDMNPALRERLASREQLAA